MVTDFARQYSPPGVYIEENETTSVTSSGIPPTLVALVGPARGYQVNTEQIALDKDAAVRLSKQGIDTDSISVTVASTRVSVAGTEYAATKVGDTSAQEYYVEVLQASGSDLDEGTSVFVSYRYTAPEYFSPKRVSSYEDVKDLYGEPLNLAVSTPGDDTYQYVLSDLSLAAKVAFENGASDVYLCATTPPDASATTDSAKSSAHRTALAAAYEKMSTLAEINLVVGVASGIATSDATGAFTDLANHVENATADGYLRFGVIGFDAAVTTAPDSLISTSGSATKRVMLAYTGPSGLLMYSGAGNSSFAVGHQYLAAAYAGRMANLPVQVALTKQPVSSFVGLAGTPLSNSLKNQYAAAGVAVTEVDRRGRLVVRHGVTTDPSNVNTREAAVVRARDAMVNMLQDGMDNSGLIGDPIDDTLLLSVKSAVQGMLEYAVAQETIIAYSGLAIRQVSADPSVVEVKFAYKPAYPLNYIVISFSIDMTTGTTAETDTTNEVV